MSRNILFISVDTIKDRTGLHVNVDPKLVFPDILYAQDAYILPALGYTVTEEAIEESIATNSIEATLTETLCMWIDSQVSPWTFGSIEATSVSDLILENFLIQI